MTEEDEAGPSRSAKLRSTDASLGVTLSPWMTRATSGRRQSGSQRTLRRRRSSHNWKATVLEPSLIGRVLTRRAAHNPPRTLKNIDRTRNGECIERDSGKAGCGRLEKYLGLV